VERKLLTRGVVRVDAVVAYLGVGHCQDLAAIGGVGQRFLVTGQAGVENNFAGGFTLCAKGPAFEN